MKSYKCIAIISVCVILLIALSMSSCSQTKKWTEIMKKHNINTKQVSKNYKKFFVTAEKCETSDSIITYYDATVITDSIDEYRIYDSKEVIYHLESEILLIKDCTIKVFSYNEGIEVDNGKEIVVMPLKTYKDVNVRIDFVNNKMKTSGADNDSITLGYAKILERHHLDSTKRVTIQLKDFYILAESVTVNDTTSIYKNAISINEDKDSYSIYISEEVTYDPKKQLLTIGYGNYDRYSKTKAELSEPEAVIKPKFSATGVIVKHDFITDDVTMMKIKR